MPRAIPSSIDVRKIRRLYGLSQSQFAALFGVHCITVSKWERALSKPTPWMGAILQAATETVRRRPAIGQKVAAALVEHGVAFALYLVLAGE